MQHQLPKLEYDYNALEPYIDTQTMEIHHSKHHQGYTDKFNTVLEKYPELQEMAAEDVLRDLEKIAVDEADRTAIRNNGGGYANHALFWKIMGPEKQIDTDLVAKIEETFGSLEAMKEQFTTAATTQFGSGWAWLAQNVDGDLEVYATPNQDSPLTKGHQPILCLDVWEHAYYLKYQNKRPEYIEQWWNIVKII